MNVNLPINDKLEAFVLSAAVNSINALCNTVEQCDEDDFFNFKNKIIFTCLKTLFDKGVYITLQALMFEISKQDKKNEIDHAYATALHFEYWSGMPYDQYITELKNISLLRKIINSSKTMIDGACKDDANSEKILGEHQDYILKAQGLASKSILSAEEISANFNKTRDFKQDLEWRCEQYRKGLKTYEGISSGFDILDDTLGSFQNGYIYTIGARTSMGKTTFMLNLVKNVLKNKRVGIFSLEMSAPIIYAKLACMEAGIRYRDFYDGKVSPNEIRRVALIEERFSKLPLFIDDEASLTTQKLDARAKRFKQNKKIDILFIDYLTRIKCNGKYFSKHLEIDEITKSVQALAKKLDIPIVMLAQLNRQAVTATKSRPSMIDFKESGSIEEDSDACLLLHRPEYYNKIEKPGIMEVIVDKNRIMGTRKIIEFYCDSSKSETYKELSEIQDEIKATVHESKLRPLSYAERYGDDDDE